MTRFLVYDVFTDRPFGGNQLAVIPDAREVPEDRLQRIAREFNFSETVFLYSPIGPGETWRARIFTPGMEVPFAGHPTVGAGVALAEMGEGPELTLELGIGPVRLELGDGEAAFTVTRPLEILAEVDPALVARALGLEPGQVLGQPIRAGVGLDFVLAELESRAALSACRPVTDAFRDGAARYPQGLDFAIFAYIRDAETVHARMFAPLDGIPEDPATGSAAAALAALLARAGPLRLVLHQGEDMGRPSRIELAAEPGSVRVSGRAVRTMEGRLTL